jgi:hypothetical protein
MIERRDLLAAAGLAALVCAVFAPALTVGFYSDDYERRVHAISIRCCT